MMKETQLQRKKDQIRKTFLKYTRKAFRMLPILDKPRILDIGCGSGVPTMELARLSNGEITALDIDESLLELLGRKIEKAGFSDRVKTMKRPMLDMEFPEESFDIIWAEGSIFVIGFERGLQEWQRFLKPNGYLVVHDEKGNITEKIKQISSCGYQLINHFILTKDTWWREYYAPLEKAVNEIHSSSVADPSIFEELSSTQQEIGMFKKAIATERFSSVYFIMRKR